MNLGWNIAQPTQIPIVRGQVVVIIRDAKLGDLLKLEDLSVISVPAELLPRDIISDPALAAGKYIKSDMVQGEMVLEHNLAQPTNVNHDLAYILSDDHVLMGLSIDDVMTKEGIIQRGDIVDIYITISEEAPVTTNSSQQQPASTQTAPEISATALPRKFTFPAFQNTNITALVMDIVQDQNQNQNALQPTPMVPTRQKINIRAYLLSMNPQDALVLKHLVDNGGKFDLVLRSPTSTQPFDLRPVTQEYIVELYGLEVLK
jgi:Flp pilus assembly protein CpaB